MVVVPNITSSTPAAAGTTLSFVGLVLGNATGTANDPIIPAGAIISQDPAAGEEVDAGSSVSYVLSLGPVPPPPVVPGAYDWFKDTAISQYANSPIIQQLLTNMAAYIDPRKNLLEFYNTIWNVDTANDAGLKIWGRIVGIARVIPIPGTSGKFGFNNSDVPPDWQNFRNQFSGGGGGPFYAGQIGTGGFSLDTESYRTLILVKALANIVSTDAPSLNSLVRNLFPNRGRAYTIDRGNMAMSYIFEFALTPIEFAILSFSGVLPHPAGVLVNVIVIQGGRFGFRESGNRQHGFRETGLAGSFYSPA